MRAFVLAITTVAICLAMIVAASADQTIVGRVRDSSGKAVVDATVSLEVVKAAAKQATTDRDGKFILSWNMPGAYLLRVRKEGYRDTTQVLNLPLKTADLLIISLSPTPSETAGIQFSDNPDFTVAGITDWTAAGGHGSDVNLRASEALASDTRTFNSPPQVRADSEAEHALRTAVLKNPSSFHANYALGKFCLREHHFVDAIAPLEKAQLLKADDYGNSFFLAEAYQGAGEHEMARRLTEQLLHESERAELHALLGDIEESLNDSLVAEREYERAVQMEGSEQNYFAWGSELLVHRAIQPAIDVFTKGAKAFPKSERMFVGLGAAFYASGEYEAGAERVCEASDVAPSDPQAYLFLGQMVEASPRQLPCAEEKLGRFIQQKPDDSLADYYYAVALTRKGASDARKAEEFLQKAVNHDPKLARAQLELGVLQSQRGNWEDARASYEKAVAVEPGFPDPHFRLAQLYKRNGDEQKAIEELKIFQRLKQSDAAVVEQRRREIRQFVVVLKNPSTSPAN